MIFFDFEVFKYDWLVVIIDLFKESYTTIVNDKDALLKFYEDNKYRIWSGYNGKKYDKYIMQAILCDIDPHKVSNHIIITKQSGYTYDKKMSKYPLTVFDPLMINDGGLKTLEGFMGNNIKETSVNFNINRKLTDKEIFDVIKYCVHDVEQCIDVVYHRFNALNSTLTLIEKFNLIPNCIQLSNAQLSAKILDAKRVDRDDEFDLYLPSNLKLHKYKYVADWYMNPLNRNYNKNLETTIAGIKTLFGWGGVHSALKKYASDLYHLIIDVESLYPNLMVLYDLLSRNVTGKERERFKMILEDRLKFKKIKGHPLNKPYKNVLNPTYGAMKDPYNDLYDPRNANLVILFGQLFILDLVEKIEDYCSIVQLNTDGIALRCKPEMYDVIDDIVYEWEKRTGLKMEFKEYKKIVQKDVNNYIAVEIDGKAKCVGGWVKDKNPLDNNLSIINIAMVNYIVHGIDVEETIYNCNDLVKYQMLVKLQGNFTYVMHNGKAQDGKVFRVFASKDYTDGSIGRIKAGKATSDKFADTPSHCFICNENLNDKVINDRFIKKLDKEFYIDLAYNRLSQFGIKHNKRGQLQLAF